MPEGHCANRSLSAVEPVSAPPKRKLENRHQRPEPETRPARAEMPEIADQRLGHPSLTCGNVGDSPPPGNNPPETGLRGCPEKIRTFESRDAWQTVGRLALNFHRRKEWTSAAIGASLCRAEIRADWPHPGSCPAGYGASAGLRG